VECCNDEDVLLTTSRAWGSALLLDGPCAGLVSFPAANIEQQFSIKPTTAAASSFARLAVDALMLFTID
jgi:hypothetical protein